MSNQKLDMDKLDRDFEFILDGAETNDQAAFRINIPKVDFGYSHCSKNYGQPCNNSSNSSCPGRGEGVANCSSTGVSYCPKVNNQGCHGAGRVSANPKRS